MGLEFYKKEQGYYTRMGTALGLGLLSVLGCWSLYNKLDGITSLTPTAKVWVQAGVPAVLFLVLGWAIYKVLNTPKYADFMIATEGEMKKVSWSSKKEIITSTKVVIWTVLILSVLLAAVDFGFQVLFRFIHVLK